MPHVDVQMLSTVFAVLGSVIAFVIIYLTSESLIRQWKLRQLPRVPGGMSLLRQLPAMALHPLPWDYMASWIDNTKYNIMFWGLPFQDFVIVRGGEAMKQVLQTRFKDWHKEMSLSFHPFLCIFGTGLVTSEGPLWQKQRKTMTPAFKGDILQDVIGIGQRAVQRLMTKIDDIAGTGRSIEIEEEFRLLTLQVITEAIMSLPYQESDRVFPKLYLPIMEECHLRVLQRWREYLPILPSWWSHRSRIRQLDAFVIGLLRTHRQQIETRAASSDTLEAQDMLDAILLGKRAAGEAWSADLEKQLCYELKTFLLAGHETSASMLTLTLLEVLHNPAHSQRILAEAEAVLGPPGSQREPTAAEAEEGMQYTRACLQEALRKYSIVPLLVRVAVRDTELLGHNIPAGTKCSLMVSSTHKLWQEPQEFRPERFLPGGEFEQFPEETRRFMYVPFGQGPRVCIGQHFSLMESRVVLATLLQHFDMQLQRPYEIKWRANILPSQPEGGVPVTADRRS
eukprot:jgi/Ulvmu1/208/UM001_0212.1